LPGIEPQPAEGFVIIEASLDLAAFTQGFERRLPQGVTLAEPIWLHCPEYLAIRLRVPASRVNEVSELVGRFAWKGPDNITRF
jgi:hypothetical protein